jgi:hypothetical protein
MKGLDLIVCEWRPAAFGSRGKRGPGRSPFQAAKAI